MSGCRTEITPKIIPAAHVTIPSAAALQAFFADIYAEARKARPGLGHRALAQAAGAHKLLRHYTMNIDGLAETAGMDTWHVDNNPAGELLLPHMPFSPHAVISSSPMLMQQAHFASGSGIYKVYFGWGQACTIISSCLRHGILSLHETRDDEGNCCVIYEYEGTTVNSVRMCECDGKTVILNGSIDPEILVAEVLPHGSMHLRRLSL